MRNRKLRCHWWSNGYHLHLICETYFRFHGWCNGFQLHLLCEAQNCVFTVVASDFNYTCAIHRIALSLVEQRLSITLFVRSAELRCHLWSNGFQLRLCEKHNCVVTGFATAFNYIWCAKQNLFFTGGATAFIYTFAKQNCVVTGVLTAFNYTCFAKHRIALSLVEQRLSISLVRSTEFSWHWWSNGFQ